MGLSHERPIRVHASQGALYASFEDRFEGGRQSPLEMVGRLVPVPRMEARSALDEAIDARSPGAI
jgi:hypothetical protein